MAQSFKREVIRTERAPKPAGVYSQAFKITGEGALLFMAGQTSRDLVTGEIIHKGDVRAQTRQVLEHIKGIVETAGGTLQDLVKVTVLYRDVRDIPAVAEIRREYFPHEPPCSTGFGAILADPDLLVEIEATAVIGRSNEYDTSGGTRGI